MGDQKQARAQLAEELYKAMVLAKENASKTTV